MTLVVDIGNTHTDIGVFDGDKLYHSTISTHSERTRDEYCVFLHEIFNLHKFKKRIAGAIISSVVPQTTQDMSKAINILFNVDVVQVEAGIKTGITIKYDNPREVGADRIVNAVAAYSEFKTNLIIIDYGTAITFDVVSDKGEYIGGAISPGISIASEALSEKTAKLPKVPLVIPPSPIGRNTTASIQAGLVYGYISMVEGMIRRIKKEINDETVVIATGGQARFFHRCISSVDHLRPHLTLYGLKILYEKNK
jgi:type III pantothenate kinase